MPHKAKTHAEARLSCCAGCGIRRVKLVVKPAVENLIIKYAQPEYDMAYVGGAGMSCIVAS